MGSGVHPARTKQAAGDAAIMLVAIHNTARGTWWGAEYFLVVVFSAIEAPANLPPSPQHHFFRPTRRRRSQLPSQPSRCLGYAKQATLLEAAAAIPFAYFRREHAVDFWTFVVSRRSAW